jgi:hypothetical protein
MKSLSCLPAFIILCIAITGCSKYYLPVKSVQSPMETMKESIEEERYSILRAGSSAFAINNAQLSESEQLISCDLSMLPKEHMKYIKAGSKRKRYYYINKPDSVVLNETHIYTTHISNAEIGNRIKIPVASIIAIEKIEYDKKRTKLMNGIGITFLVATVIATTILIIEMSSWDFGN